MPPYQHLLEGQEPLAWPHPFGVPYTPIAPPTTKFSPPDALPSYPNPQPNTRKQRALLRHLIEHPFLDARSVPYLLSLSHLLPLPNMPPSLTAAFTDPIADETKTYSFMLPSAIKSATSAMTLEFFGLLKWEQVKIIKDMLLKLMWDGKFEGADWVIEQIKMAWRFVDSPAKKHTFCRWLEDIWPRKKYVKTPHPKMLGREDLDTTKKDLNEQEGRGKLLRGATYEDFAVVWERAQKLEKEDKRIEKDYVARGEIMEKKRKREEVEMEAATTRQSHNTKRAKRVAEELKRKREGRKKEVPYHVQAAVDGGYAGPGYLKYRKGDIIRVAHDGEHQLWLGEMDGMDEGKPLYFGVGEMLRTNDGELYDPGPWTDEW